MVHTGVRIPQTREDSVVLKTNPAPLDSTSSGFFIVGVVPGENPVAVFIALGRQEAIDGDIDPAPHKFALGGDGTCIVDCYHCVGNFNGHNVDDELRHMLDALSWPERGYVRDIRCHHGSFALEPIRPRAH